MAAGDFSASALLDINLKAEAMWSNGAQAAMYQSHADSAKAVLENQTARFTELNDKDKDLKVKVTWLNPCGIVDEDCEGNCDISEPEIEAEAKEYEYDICRKTGFSVNRDTLRTSSYDAEEVRARGMAMSIKKLDEFWAKQVLLKAKAFAGINVAPSPWTFNGTTMDTEVPTASYDLTMIPYLMKQAMLNQLSSPYYIEKGDLYVPYLNAKFNAGNAEGKGDQARINALNMYFDMWNFAAAGITEDLFAIDASAIAMKTHAKHPDSPMLIGGSVQHTIYTVNSQMLPGVKYDVFYTLACQEQVISGKTRTQYVDTWRLETNGLIALNPEACEVTVSGTTYRPNGVLSYAQV